MATNSHIGYQDEGGEFHVIYCHWDGYTSHNGKILFENYKNLTKVKRLISLGNLSVLAPSISTFAKNKHTFDAPVKGVCVFYGRDRGETKNQAVRYVSEAQLRRCTGNHVYIFKDDKWYKLSHTGFVLLEELLIPA